MGDNRYNSADSRYNQDEPGKGFVPIEKVVGRAVVVSWPFDRWAWLENRGDLLELELDSWIASTRVRLLTHKFLVTDPALLAGA
jgi:hypothetical protein